MNDNFNSWTIGENLYNWIINNIEKNSTILELGSGDGSTSELVKNYIVYSIEHDKNWVDKIKGSNYIYAPIVDKWYDVNILKNNLNINYDLILVDGPPGFIGRFGFLKNIELFNTNVPIIIDDVQRKDELNLLIDVSKYLNKQYKIYDDSYNKKFGIIKN